MPESHSIASTVASWVSGPLVWVISYLAAYTVRNTATQSEKARNELLKNLQEEVANIRQATQTSLTVLERIEEITREARDNDRDVFIIERRPRSSLTARHTSI